MMKWQTLPHLRMEVLPHVLEQLIVDRHIRLLSSQGMGLCAKHKGPTE